MSDLPQIINTDTNDITLVVQARAGNRHALEILLERNWIWLRVLAGSLINFDGIDDILQNVCIRVMLKINTLREPERFRQWLAVILRREVINWRKKHQRDRTVPINDELDLPDDSFVSGLDSDLNQSAVYRAIRLLPESQREVLMLKYMCEHSYSQIAEILDISIASVQNRLFRARRQMALLLEERNIQKI